MKNSQCIFVTGTGTDVGKTFVAGSLLLGLSAQLTARYFKPVQTGHPDSDTDLLRLRLAKKETVSFDEPLFVYDLPASPDQAAEAEGRKAPDIQSIKRSADAMNADFNIIEGAGGLLVPLNHQNDTWLSFLFATKTPVLLVASSGLGTINHTCLSLDALKLKGIPVLGTVLSGPLHSANHQTIARMHPDVPVFSLPMATDLESPEYLANCRALAEFVDTTVKNLPAAVNLATVVEKHIWFPYSQHKTMEFPLEVKRAKGATLTLADGRTLIDGTSSWWVNNVGHGRPEIADAIHRQQQTADHTIFAGMWHEPAALLAKSLVELNHPGLTRVFFSDNGSTALEVALKIAFQSFSNCGRSERNLFLSLKGSYHGDTFGAMSISDSGGFHGLFRPLLFTTETVAPATRHPSIYCPNGNLDLAARLEDFNRAFEQHKDRLAGIVIEPMVMGAAGMLMQPAAYLQHISRRCREAGVPLIADEVFTGFCRTGSWFAYQQAGIEPDIVAVAKGITGGTMPLAATLARESFFEAFLSDSKSKALMHGHSYTANPVGCAAANAAIKIMKEDDLNGKALALARTYQAWTGKHTETLGLEQPRILGGILAFELQGSGSSNDYFHPKSGAIGKIAAEEGLFLRPLGNTVYFMPPLSIAPNELDAGLAGLGRVLKRVRTAT